MLAQQENQSIVILRIANSHNQVDLTSWTQLDEFCWTYPNTESFPIFAYGNREKLIRMDPTVFSQALSLTSLPGLSTPVAVLPGAHPGYAMPYGSVVGFSTESEGSILCGDCSWDNAYGIRCLTTGLLMRDHENQLDQLSGAIQRALTRGEAQRRLLNCDRRSFDSMLLGGAHWSVEQGWGLYEDLRYCEQHGKMARASPDTVTRHIKDHTLKRLSHPGNGFHHIELLSVDKVYNSSIASVYGLCQGSIVIAIEGGSIGLSERLCREITSEMKGITWAPIQSEMGQKILGSTHAALNCALAYRQILTDIVRNVIGSLWTDSCVSVLLDISHNSVQKESHLVGHDSRRLWVQRQGSCRASGPSRLLEPTNFCKTGQPVLLGGESGCITELVCGVDSSEQRTMSTSGWLSSSASDCEQAGLIKRIVRLKSLDCIQG